MDGFDLLKINIKRYFYKLFEYWWWEKSGDRGADKQTCLVKRKLWRGKKITLHCKFQF